VAERSKALLKAGIPGIRYLDGGSRGAGDGTRNFVVFDENNIRITEENGQPVDGWQQPAEPEPLQNPAAPNETQSRFASPNPADRVINGPRTDELVTAEANAWLNSMDQQAAIEAFVAGQVPLSLDTAERAAATLIANLSEQAATAKTEVARMWAHVQGRRMARVWTTEHLSADPARALRQRGVVNNTILAPIAPVLAAQELLEDRAKKVIDNRFDGGTEGAVEKVKDVVKKADEQAGTDLAEQLEDTTSTATDPRIADLEARLKVLREQIQNREAEADTTLKETSSTWQKILNVLNSASQRKSKLLNGVKGRVASMRKAALERKAARRAEGRLSANPIEDFADDVIIGTSLLAEGIVEFSNWSQALVREIGARSAADLRKLYAEASKEYLSLLEAEKARPATSLQSKHPNLKKMLDALRKKMFPGMTWADIFTQLPETQKARQREIYRRLMLDERLRNLTPQERLALTNELDKAWMRERRKVFMRELEKAKVLGEKKPKDREKVKAAAPRLLRLMNLGMLNSEMFREALAKEYGLNMIDAAAAADLRALGERIQKAPEGLRRRKLEQQLVERLQKLSGYTLFQVMDSWWTAAVLSGWRTLVDIGLGIANGIEDIGLGSIVAALRSGNKDVAVRGLSALFGRIPSAFMEAVDHVATGNKAMMRSFELEVKQAMEGGNLLASDVGRQMWDRGGWRKVPGGFMVFYGRLMTALDHVNSSSTREGAKALALARHPDLYQKALRISDADRSRSRPATSPAGTDRRRHASHAAGAHRGSRPRARDPGAGHPSRGAGRGHRGGPCGCPARGADRTRRSAAGCRAVRRQRGEPQSPATGRPRQSGPPDPPRRCHHCRHGAAGACHHRHEIRPHRGACPEPHDLLRPWRGALHRGPAGPHRCLWRHPRRAASDRHAGGPRALSGLR
jgi:hypothetical protein